MTKDESTQRENSPSSGQANLKDLTVVVPTYDRVPYLMRTLRFITYFDFGKVVVVDGTPGTKHVERLRAEFPEVTYIHSETGFVNRVSIATQHIATKYVALWGDDEFWLPSFMSNAVEFMEANQETVMCLGLAISFETTPALSFGPIYPGLRNLTLSGNNARERLAVRFSNYVWGGLWGISRTEAWIRSWSVAALNEFPVRGATEIQFEASMAWQGSVQILQELAWLRSLESDSITSTPDVSLNIQNPLFHFWWRSASNLERSMFTESFQNILLMEMGDRTFLEDVFRSYSLKERRRIAMDSVTAFPANMRARFSRLLNVNSGSSGQRTASAWLGLSGELLAGRVAAELDLDIGIAQSHELELAIEYISSKSYAD